jgi:hypothetical protein
MFNIYDEEFETFEEELNFSDRDKLNYNTLKRTIPLDDIDDDNNINESEVIDEYLSSMYDHINFDEE